MMKPGQLVIVLVTAGAVIAAAVMVKIHVLPAIAAAFLIGCVLVDGIWEGEITYGLRNARRVVRKKDAPFAFWAAVCFYVCLLVALAIVAIKSGSNRQSVSTRLEEEPNQPPEPTRASARLRIEPQDRVAHL